MQMKFLFELLETKCYYRKVFLWRIWSFTNPNYIEPQLHHLQGFVMRCLRIILRVSIREKNDTPPSGEWLSNRNSPQCSPSADSVGHISWVNDSCLPKQLLVCAPVDGKCAAGGQNYCWNDLVSKDLKKL